MESTSIDFNKFQFAVEQKRGPFAKRDIYKYMPNRGYFILVSPNYTNGDRRKAKVEIEALLRDKKLIPYTKSSKVFELINKAWKNYSDKWEYNGETFYVDPSKYLDEAPWHNTSFGRFKVGYHQGSLVWVGGFQYNPKVPYCKFESFGKDPDWGKVAWTGLKNIHPVWCDQENKYI